MPDLDTRPQVVNFDIYAGDTLTIHIKITPEVVAGRSVFAQIRSKATSHKIDATFSSLPTATGMDIILASESSKALAKRGMYDGVWDVQLATASGGDPVTTLGYGDMRIHPDVTRLQT